jgi:hypothetical protein
MLNDIVITFLRDSICAFRVEATDTAHRERRRLLERVLVTRDHPRIYALSRGL